MSEPAPSDCIFCRIVRGELGTELVAESEYCVAFCDLHPQAPVHILIVPRRHFSALRAVDDDGWRIVADALALGTRVAEQEGLYAGGYRLVTNDGPDVGQTVPHLHFHLLGGGPLQVGLA